MHACFWNCNIQESSKGNTVGRGNEDGERKSRKVYREVMKDVSSDTTTTPYHQETQKVRTPPLPAAAAAAASPWGRVPCPL